MLNNDEGKQERAFSLSPKELWLLVREVPDPRDKAIIHLLAGLGCSTSELVKIQAKHIREDGMLVGEGTSKSRVITPQEDAQQILDALVEGLSPEDHLFESRQKKPLTKRRIEQILAKASKKLDRKIVGKSLQRSTKTMNKMLDDEQKDAYMSSLGRRAQLMAQIVLETGCTVSELVNLRANDIQEEGIFIHAGFSKRKNDVTIDVPKSLLNSIEAHMKRNNLAPKDIVFSKKSNRNKGLTPLRIQQMLAYKTSDGLKVTPQVLRNTFLARLIKERKPVNDICNILGVKRITMK